jgi:hypothetical protein
LAGDGTADYYPLTDPKLPGSGEPSAGFNGSVVISSNQPVAAVSNILGSDGSNPLAYGASYSAASSGSTSVSLPTLMKNNYGFTTFFNVQNAGGGAANVNVTYSDGVTASASSLAPGAAAKFDQATENHSGKIFSGVVTSTEPLVVTVLEVGPSTLFAYSGVGTGSTNPVFPLVNANNYGYFTSILLKNLSGTATNVTVTYTPAFAGTACTETRNVPANGDVIFTEAVFTFPKAGDVVTENCSLGQRFVGSAAVTANSAGVQLAAVVNQLNSGANKGAAYSAFSPAEGQQKVVFPLIMDRNYDYWTSWSIVNVGGSQIAANAITCTVSGKDRNGATVTKTFKNPSAIAVNGGWTEDNINKVAPYFVGGATCVGPSGSKLVGSVNEVNVAVDFDAFLVYEGFSVSVP